MACANPSTNGSSSLSCSAQLFSHTFTAVGGEAPPPAARQGRHKQRYGAGGERLVAGCIPVRVNGNGEGAEAVEVLLVTSRGGKGYCLPKGGWEDDETVEAAAKRETVEEAGVRGILEEPFLGTFFFQSGKPTATDTRAHQGKCIAHMYVMHVAEELETWPESTERQRVWFPLSEASKKCRHLWMREALMEWCRRQGWHHICCSSESVDLNSAPSGQPALSASISEASDASESPSVDKVK